VKTARPKLAKNDPVRIAAHMSVIPAYDDKPFVGRDTTLYVWTLTGRGTKRDPWRAVATDNAGHFWHFEPDDLETI
jgi:hypothetical protein